MNEFDALSPPYSTIVADPPWSYSQNRHVTASKQGAGAVDKYSTMTNEAIAALPVGHLAAPDAHLYLWTTNPHLFGGGHVMGPAQIMEAWGFRYVTLLTWLKTGAMGMGYYFRGETEHVLFGVRGNLVIPPAKRERNIVKAAKTGHSVKPPAFYDLVERVSPGPYVELFARQPRLGWDAWGHGHEGQASYQG